MSQKIKYHIDGSICRNRKSMPTKSQIAFYWKENTIEYFDYLMDWGEPSCWACGIWNGHMDIDLEGLKQKQIFKVWNKHRYLERCHVLPNAHGGCCCEANLVLLCKRCHKTSPDTKSTKLFLDWIKNRRSWFYYWEKDIKEAIVEMNYEFELEDKEIIKSLEFGEFLKNSVILVGGEISKSSFIACLIEYKELINK